MRVFVLLFNVGTENEGIHTLKLKQDGRNVVLMFESEDDATRYGVMLEAQDFMTPAVECIESEEVEEFCQDLDYECVLVPDGTLAMPPEEIVERTDWQIDEEPSTRPPTDSASEASEFSTSELERIRRRLEGLL